MAKSIVFIIPNLQMGGAEAALVTLANEWVNTAKITIITFDKGSTFFTIDPRINIVPLDTTNRKFSFLSPAFNFIQRFVKLPLAIKRLGCDITIPFMDTSIMWNFFARPFVKQPMIMVFQLTPSKAIMSPLFMPFRKTLYPRAEAAVILTKDTKPVFNKLGINLPEKTFVIPNALAGSVVTSEKNLREDVILGLGRLSPQKQFHKLIGMYQKLQPTNWKLWIVGEGESRTELEALIKHHGLEDKIILWGAQKNVSEFYSKAKIFAMTSAYEGFCVALCEAMANGCASVSFDCEVGPSDSIIDNYNGLLIENQNEEKFISGVSYLMQHPEDRERIAENGRRIIDKLNIQTIVHKWDEAVSETSSRL